MTTARGNILCNGSCSLSRKEIVRKIAQLHEEFFRIFATRNATALQNNITPPLQLATQPKLWFVKQVSEKLWNNLLFFATLRN